MSEGHQFDLGLPRGRSQSLAAPPADALRAQELRTLEMIRGIEAKITRLQRARSERLAALNKTRAELALAQPGPVRHED